MYLINHTYVAWSHGKFMIANSKAPRCCLLELGLSFPLLILVSLPAPSLPPPHCLFLLFPSGLDVCFQEKAKAIGVPRLCSHASLPTESIFISAACHASGRGQPLPLCSGYSPFLLLLASPSWDPTLPTKVFRRKGYYPVLNLLLAAQMQGGLGVSIG